MFSSNYRSADPFSFLGTESLFGESKSIHYEPRQLATRYNDKLRESLCPIMRQFDTLFEEFDPSHPRDGLDQETSQKLIAGYLGLDSGCGVAGGYTPEKGYPFLLTGLFRSTATLNNSTYLFIATEVAKAYEGDHSSILIDTKTPLLKTMRMGVLSLILDEQASRQ